MLKQRIITAVILLVGFLAALLALPDIGWSLLSVAIVAVGASEWARLSSMDKPQTNRYLALTLIFMLALAALHNFATPDVQLIPFLLVYIAAAVFWILAVPAWMISGWKPGSPHLLGLTGWLVLLPTGLAIMELRAISPWLLLGLMALVWVADSAAYFAGRRFGKNKLAPAISPGKTWEGVAGALLAVGVYVFIVAYATGLNKQYLVFPPGVMAAWWWVGLSIIGDLFESMIKRQAGVKDSGTILPGHGGLLDRIDALTPTLPLAALVLLLQRLE